MELMQQLFANSQFPLLTAFLMGLLVAIHPCPLATNIAAMGYIVKAKSGESRFSLLVNGLLYTLGRTISYSLLGIVMIIVIKGGAQVMRIGEQMSEWGERLLAPLLIAIGLYLLYTDLLHHHDHVPSTKDPKGWFHGACGSLLLGIVFAMAFCPESGIVYFGMIIPMSVESSAGYLIPVGFAIGTALPVLLMAYVFAYSIQSFERISRGMHQVQVWLTRIVAVLFILAGVFCMVY